MFLEETESIIDNEAQDPSFLPNSNDSSSSSDTESDAHQICGVTDHLRYARARGENSTVAKPLAHSRKNRQSRKRKRNLGEEYETALGKKVRSRALQPLPACRNKCREKISLENRKSIHSEYWALGDHNKRVSFIADMVDTKPTATTRKREVDEDKQKNRTVTHTFFLKVNGQRVKVCRGCFLKILDETQMFVTTCLQKSEGTVSGIISKDDRRGQAPPSNKHSDEKIKEVIEHIKSFPQYKSHYTRRESNKKYLPPHLNLQKMYNLYCEGRTNNVSRSIYEREFKKLNISFKHPKVDTCHKCDVLALKLKIAEDCDKLSINEEIKQHHSAADEAYLDKARSKDLAKTDPAINCVSFDLQQCLPTPFLNSSVAFYKRQLWTFNLTVHNLGTSDVVCYMWHEAEGGRGGNQIATCLFKYMASLPQEVKRIILYSDTCGGQNKNSHVCAMFLTAIQINPNLEIIDHKFMVSGHSHMECDVDHSMIEKQKKKLEFPISHPHDWYNLVRSTGKKGKKMSVVEVKNEEFLDFASLLKKELVVRKKNSEGNPFLFHKVQWMRYTRASGKILYKLSLDEEEPFLEFNLTRRGQEGVKLTPKKCYNAPLPISTEKKKDLLDLLPLIPPVFHEFYKSLRTNSVAQDTIITSLDSDLIEFE